MDNSANNKHTNKDSPYLRDNFENIQEFMNKQNYGEGHSQDDQDKKNRELRDNFKDIQEFMNTNNDFKQ